jgi:hypothetical protein
VFEEQQLLIDEIEWMREAIPTNANVRATPSSVGPTRVRRIVGQREGGAAGP